MTTGPDSVNVELVCDSHARVGEGPVWDTRSHVLWWVDITGQKLHRFNPSDASDVTFDFDHPVASVALRESGALIVADASRVFSFDPETGDADAIAVIETGAATLNDGKCDPRGRFWIGSSAKDPGRHPLAGSLYRLDKDLSVTKSFSDVSLSNGLDWSPDGRTFYFTDTRAFRIDRMSFDLETGTVSDRTLFVQFEHMEDPLVGPDGLCVDAEGFVWVAIWGGAVVQKFSARGEMIAEIKLPVDFVTSCTFGGADMRDLYITTASEGAEQQHAGGLFRCRPGPQGRPPHRYMG